MKIALCLFGLPKYSDYVLNTLKQNVLDLHDVDIYGHFWWSEDMIGEFKHRSSHDKWEPDTIEKLKTTLSFKKLVLEPQSVFDLSGYSFTTIEPDLKAALTSKVCKDIIFSNKSKWDSTYKSYSLIDSPEDYDYIIITRLDVDYSCPLDVAKLSKEVLYIQDGYRSGADRKYSDHFAIGSPAMIYHYANIWKYTDTYHTHGLTHLHKHFEKLLNTDIIVPHEVISLGVWYLHPSLFKHMRNGIHYTNEKYV